MRIKRRTILIIGIVITVLIACPIATGVGAYIALRNPAINSVVKELMSTFGDMVALQQEVAPQYQAEAVQINLMNGNVLVVSLVNSPFNDLTDAKQRSTAKELAQFVKDHYSGSSTISEIQVTFVKHAELLGVSANQARTYVFEVTDLK